MMYRVLSVYNTLADLERAFCCIPYLRFITDELFDSEEREYVLICNEQSLIYYKDELDSNKYKLYYVNNAAAIGGIGFFVDA